MVEQVERIPPELGVRLTEEREALRERRVEVHVTGRVEDAPARVAVGVRWRGDEIRRIEPEIDGGIVQPPIADAVQTFIKPILEAPKDIVDIAGKAMGG